MNQQEKQVILDRAKSWMRSNIVSPHLSNTRKLSKVKELKINPLMLPYIANFYNGNTDYRSLAEALVLPRALGTSPTTTFGTAAQKFVSTVFSSDNFGSVVSGIDIEFVDAVDGRRKYSQLKSGPSALNKDDVATIKGHFIGVRNLARTNHMDIRLEDMVLGILYGEKSEMNANIKAVGKEYPVYAGKEFWFRFSGDDNFYEDLALAMAEVADEINARDVIEETIDALAKDIISNFPELSHSKRT
ncbi:MAG: hypothetical protein NVSMB46_03380 [Candidatus Saccharimonadales bacterium]